ALQLLQPLYGGPPRASEALKRFAILQLPEGACVNLVRFEMSGQRRRLLLGDRECPEIACCRTWRTVKGSAKLEVRSARALITAAVFSLDHEKQLLLEHRGFDGHAAEIYSPPLLACRSRQLHVGRTFCTELL